MKKLFSKASFIVFFTILLSSCSATISTGGGDYYTNAEYFVSSLNSYYGSNVSLIKEHGSHADTYNYIVVYDNYSGEYISYNLAYYTPGMSFSSYLAQSGYYDIQGNLQYDNYYGEFYSPLTGMWFEENSNKGKDLEKFGALIEDMKTNKLADNLSQEFGLSEERGQEIAKLASQYEKVKKTRSLTEKDLDVFSKKALGVNLSELNNAAKKSSTGDRKPYNNILKKIAETNGVSPEQINNILDKFSRK